MLRHFGKSWLTGVVGCVSFFFWMYQRTFSNNVGSSTLKIEFYWTFSNTITQFRVITWHCRYLKLQCQWETDILNERPTWNKQLQHYHQPDRVQRKYNGEINFVPLTGWPIKIKSQRNSYTKRSVKMRASQQWNKLFIVNLSLFWGTVCICRPSLKKI